MTVALNVKGFTVGQKKVKAVMGDNGARADLSETEFK